MKFFPQNELERSLTKAARDPAHRPQFYKDLVESEIFFINQGSPPPHNGCVTLREGEEIGIQSIEFNDKAYLPIFSSLIRLQSFVREEVTYMAMNVRQFMEITRGAELLLNPGAEFGKEFTKEEVSALLDGTMWKPSESYRAEEETQVLIGQPAKHPDALVSALARLFKQMKEVKRAYLAHFCNPSRGEEPHTLVGIETSGKWEDVAAKAGIVARNIEVPDPPVDFLQITGKSGVEEYFRNECRPFYEKKKLLDLF